MEKSKRFNTIAIIGVGLIGGSLGISEDVGGGFSEASAFTLAKTQSAILPVPLDKNIPPLTLLG